MPYPSPHTVPVPTYVPALPRLLAGVPLAYASTRMLPLTVLMVMRDAPSP